MAKRNKRGSLSSQVSQTEFNPDYSNVKKDLSRIGSLASIFIVLLIALSFFIK